jgi:hypothetical protein
VQPGHGFGLEQGGGVGMASVEGADFLPRTADFRPCPLQHTFVGGVFPKDEFFDEVEEFLAAFGEGGALLGRRFFAGMLGFPQTGGIIDQLRKDDRTSRRQRPPCPP